MEFKGFKTAVARQFERMQQHQLFRVNIDKDVLWNTYLDSFPEGTNPMFRVRREYDCSCCRQFVRTVGDVVAIIDGNVESIWDIDTGNIAFNAVGDALSALVKSQAIANPFLHYEKSAGTDKSFEDMTEGVHTWDHFYVNIKPQFVMKKDLIATALGEARAIREVFYRSLTEITDEALATTQDLIAAGSLYRGEEKKFILEEFVKLKRQFNKLTTDEDRELFTWSNYNKVHVSVAKINNDVIGTLLSDLSKDVDIEVAVRKWEAVMAPSNYKRPTALITKKMIEEAKKKLQELGLTSALERRYANIHDITVNNILFADKQARNVIEGDIFDTLSATADTKKTKSFDKVEEVSIDKFIKDILPRADKLEVLFENKHASNLVSLIAPVDPTAGNLFKWDNKFSWSYNGDMADSIKERVKKAGGNVTGELCCRLAWDYTDDLDFHMSEPDGGHIYFGNRRHKSACGGMLDLDANGADGTRADPAENIYYERIASMKEGVYTLYVNNYSRRSDGVGFVVEIDILGTVYTFPYDKVLKTGNNITVAKLKYSKANGVEIVESMPSTQTSKTVWNMPTQTFHKVNVMMLSPNFWDDKAVGNKHYFFILDGCKNEGTARGFFNEFLKEELNKHRKVFEVVGSKMKAESADDQLSGLGFSSTQKNELICKVTGSFTRVIKIVF